ncbi:uncharacterized protein CEXT_740271 [Caerostris extrusa]|uniref:Uncharacterized protein n=1 Tax=Caerostris extrusa TaxID=172846 RepID=A0AAV4SRE5_CAEEX|nr:uncharacterized protein CEXT_740271 [Caerostris extrusa]
MKDAAICKEMRKKQKHFPWLKIFLKDFIETYPHQKKALYCLIENVEKEVKELISRGRKQSITERLFETINDLLIHFWWKIHWKKNRLWKDYWKMDCLYSYHHNKISSCLEKLLYFLIYLGIILIDETVYNALLLVNNLKKKYHSSYMEILKHVLCSELILHIEEPVLYIKNIILFRRLKKFIQDNVAKTAVLTTASKIIPPSNIIPWLSSLEVIIKNEDDIVKQLFKKLNFQKLYHVLIVNQKLNMSISCKEENKEQKLSEITEKQSKSAKKSQNLQAKNRKKVLVDIELQDGYENSLKICIENNKEEKLKSKSKKKQSKSSKKSQSLKVNSIKGIDENIELTVQTNDVSEKSENKQHSETEADLHKNADEILLQNDNGVSDNLQSSVIVLSNIEDTCVENAKIQTNKSVENEPALEKEVLVDNELQDVYENSSKICIENNKEQKLKSKSKKEQSKSSKKSQSLKVNSIKGINENIDLTVQINDASEKSENKQHSETEADLHKNADEILFQNDNRVSDNLTSAIVVSNIEDTYLENAKIQTNKSLENEPTLEKEVLKSSEQLDLQEDSSKICYEENKEQKVKSKGKRKRPEKSVKKSQTKKNNENERNLHLNNGLCKVPKESRKKQSNIETELNENSNEILHQNKCDVSDNLSSLTIPINIENTRLEQAKIENNDSIKKRPKEKNDKKKSSSKHKSKKNKHKSKKEVHKSKKKHKSKKEITGNKKIKKSHFVKEGNTVESSKENYSSVLENNENVTDLTDLSRSNLIMSNTENNSVQNVNFQSTCSTENKETLEKNDKCSLKIKSKKKKSKKGHKHKKDSKDKNKKKKDTKISKHHKCKKNANKNQVNETIKKKHISVAKKVDNRESNQNMHVDNLLANYIANCSDEDERENENTSSCPVITSDTNILVPDTCQNDIIPFNLDQQESNNENVIPSEIFEKDYQQILDKSPHIHLTDIATPEKIISFESNHLYVHFKESDSNFHIPNHGIVKDHKVSTASNQSCESVHSDLQMVENVNNEIQDTNLQNHTSYQNNLDHSTFNLEETFQQINTSNKHFSTNKKETRKRAALSDENCTNTDPLGLKTPSTKRRKKLIKNKRSTIDKNPSSQTVPVKLIIQNHLIKEFDSNMQVKWFVNFTG